MKPLPSRRSRRGHSSPSTRPAVRRVDEADIEMDRSSTAGGAQPGAAQQPPDPARARRLHRDRRRTPAAGRNELALRRRIASRYSRAYRPLRASSCACRPVSTIRPRSMTQIRSAPITVERRCAMTIVVRPRIRLRSAACTCRLGFGVERRGRLVEQQDRRVLQHRARDRDALPLPAREPHAVLADQRVVALRQFADEAVGGGGSRGGLDLGVRARRTGHRRCWRAPCRRTG